MIIPVNLGKESYDIVLERGGIKRASELLNLDRKVLVVTDNGVPEEYAKNIAKQCKTAITVCVEQGEESKSFKTFEMLCKKMLEENFTRTDCVVAVGGGVVGDLSGYVAASYMRGIEFYNIPTTVLSQVDSSIGGKTAINLGNVKNIIGAFYQPKRVIIDTDVLKSLPQRQVSNGLAEAVKMALTFDKELFEIFETGNILENIDEIIEKSLEIKKKIVEQDTKEKGIRKVLNFGHTIGHGIEGGEGLKGLYHGECVALGMIPMCGGEVRERVKNVLNRLNLPTSADIEFEKIVSTMKHDKKMSGDTITVVFVNEVGKYEMKNMKFCELEPMVREALKK